MTNFKSLFKTEITDSVVVETFSLKKSDFPKFDLLPPKTGKGFLITCSDTKLFNSLILMDESEDNAKHSHDSTVAMVKKNLKKA